MMAKKFISFLLDSDRSARAKKHIKLETKMTILIVRELVNILQLRALNVEKR